MKQKKGLKVVSIVMGILIVLYIGALAMPHMDYNMSKRVPTGVGEETKLEITEHSMTVLSFLAFPNVSKEKAVEAGMKKEFNEKYRMNDASTGPILLFVLAILSAIVSFLLAGKFMGALLPLAWSIYGLIVYSTNYFLKLGGLDYMVQFVLVGIVGVIALAQAAMCLPGVIAKRKQIREEIRITKEREREMQRKREALEKAAKQA